MTATGAGSTHVLERMDGHVPSWFYWQLTLLATVGGFLFGYDTANIGSVLGFIPYPLEGLALGYLVAGASVGAAVGAFFAGPLTDRFGRKSLLIADAAIYAAGALLSAVTWNVTVLLVARTLIGLAIGADSAIATAYIAEYAPTNRRGALGMLQQWMITVGILVSYVVALVVLWLLPGSANGIDWRLILGIGAVPAIVGLVLRTRMPESPRWLMLHGRYDDARKSLGILGIEASTDEVAETARVVEQREREEGRARGGLWTAGVKRALVVVSVFFVFQQITGINVPFYYGPKVLTPLFDHGGDKVQSAIAGVEATTILALVNVIATYFAFKFIDKLGRRKLSIGGYAGMAAFMVLGAVAVSMLGGTARLVVIMIALNLFIASFAVGVGGTGWLIQGEVFPTAVRGRAAAIGATADWLANFALVLVFPIWQTAIGLAWVMVCFAALAVIALLFVAAYLPETKELSVEQITAIFEESARNGVLDPSGTRSLSRV